MKKITKIFTVLLMLLVLTIASTSAVSAFDLQIGDDDNWDLLREFWWESDYAGEGVPFYEYKYTNNYYDSFTKTYYVFRDNSADEECAKSFNALPGIVFSGEVPEETETLVIGDGIDYIRNACNDLPNLKNVVLSNTLLEVTDSFNNCPKLTKITARVAPTYSGGFHIYNTVTDKTTGEKTEVPCDSEYVYDSYCKNSFNTKAENVTLIGYKDTPYYHVASLKGFKFVELPDRVTKLTAENVPGGVEIKWDDHNNFSSYKLYKIEGKSFSYLSSKYYVGEFTGSSYLDKDVKCGKKYTYAIVPVFEGTYQEYGEETVVDARSAGEIRTDSNTVTAHNYINTLKKATATADGSIKTTCSVCKKLAKTVVIPKVTTIELAKTKLTYTGKEIATSLVVKDSKGKALKEGTDYTVKYSDSIIKVGKYTATVTLKGNYSGTKKLSFTVIPKTATANKKSSTETSVTAEWKSVSGATGYDVKLYKGSKLEKSKTVNAKTLKYTFTKLTAGTDYTVKVYTRQKADGVVFIANPRIFKIATCPSIPGITKITVNNGSATVYLKKVSGADEYTVQCSESSTGKPSIKGITVKGDTLKVTFKKLEKGKTYYFTARATAITSDGYYAYSEYSKPVKAAVK